MNSWLWFAVGFLACWIAAGVLTLLGDRYGWLDDDWYLYLTVAPLIIVPLIFLRQIRWACKKYRIHKAKKEAKLREQKS